MTKILLIALILTAGTLQLTGQIKVATSKLESDIAKLLRGYYDASSARDVEGTIRFFADDGFSYEGGYLTNLELKHALRAGLQSPAAATRTDTFEIEDLKVHLVSKDTALANYTIISTSIRDGRTEILHDRSTNVFVRRNGRWLIVADHTSRFSEPIKPSVAECRSVGFEHRPTAATSIQ